MYRNPAPVLANQNQYPAPVEVAPVYRNPAPVQAPVRYPPPGYGLGRREFKIAGKIVDPGEADGLSYGSLMYQIESAQQQGFSDIEIGSGLIKATKSQSLRSVLEGRPGARVADLIPVLKAHFTVKNVNAVFNELCRGAQAVSYTHLTLPTILRV